MWKEEHREMCIEESLCVEALWPVCMPQSKEWNWGGGGGSRKKPPQSGNTLSIKSYTEFSVAYPQSNECKIAADPNS